MSAVEVLRIFIQHYAADVPIRTFLALKQTCSAMAEVCRAVEPGCHWRRFEQHMEDYMQSPVSGSHYTSDWPALREYVRAPGVVVSYNDELPFCDVTITNCELPHIAGGSMLGKCRWHKIYGICNMRKHVFVDKDAVSVASWHSEMFITRNGLKFRSLPRSDAEQDNAQLDVFIEDVIKYSEHIKNVRVKVCVEEIIPPYQALKAVLYYDAMTSRDRYACINIKHFLLFARMDHTSV